MTTLMKYEDYRSQSKDGDIVFFKHGKTWTNRLTQLITRSSIFHTAIIFWMKDNGGCSRLMVLEAHAGGRRIVSLSSYVGTEMVIVSSKNNWPELSSEFIDRSGSVPYSYADFFTIGFKEFFGLSKVIKNFMGEVCSEMVSSFLNRSGCPLPLTLSPGALYTAILNSSLQDIVIKTVKN